MCFWIVILPRNSKLMRKCTKLRTFGVDFLYYWFKLSPATPGGSFGTSAEILRYRLSPCDLLADSGHSLTSHRLRKNCQRKVSVQSQSKVYRHLKKIGTFWNQGEPTYFLPNRILPELSMEQV